MLKNINKFSVAINIIILFIICFLLSYSFRYALVKNDDICDYLVNPYGFIHYRYLTELISRFFVVVLPELLHIHIQDFAWISESVVRALYLISIISIINCSYFKYGKCNFIMPVLSVITALYLLSSICIYDFQLCFTTTAHFVGYVLPIFSFLLFWNKMETCYIYDKLLTKKDIYIFFLILLILVLASNEIYILGSFIFMLFILFESMINSKDESVEIKNYPFIPIIIFCFISFFTLVLSLLFNIKLTDHVELSIIHSFNLKMIIDIIQLFIYRIFIQNIILWILAIISFYLIFHTKENQTTGRRICRYVLYLYLSFMFAYISTFILGETYDYPMLPGDIDNFPKYWLNYPGVLIINKMILYTSILYMLGYLSKFYKKISMICVTILCIFTVFSFWKYYNVDLIHTLETRKNAYIADKLSYFYFKKEMPAVLSYDLLLAISSSNLLPPNITGQIYYEQPYIYKSYIEKTYNVSSKYGVILLPSIESAVELYKNNGGVLTDAELKELKFSRIKSE